MDASRVVIDFVRANPERVLEHSPATPEMIRKIERQLGVTLPEDYRRFLTLWGNLVIDGCYLEYEGVRRTPDGVNYPVVDHTLLCRSAGLPERFIALAADEHEGYYCLNTESPGEMRTFDPVAATLSDPVAPGLFECINCDIEAIPEDV
jgi:SMI1 / KNR4 family.